MKLFLYYVLVFCVFGHQKHQTVVTTAIYNTYPTLNPNEYPKFTGYQEDLLNELSVQIGKVLKQLNAPYSYDHALEEEEPPVAQNISITYEDNSVGGYLLMFNTKIDGLTDLENGVEVVRDNLEIRITVKVKKLEIKGDYNVQLYNGAQENGPFSVKLENVILEGFVSMMVDPEGNMVITKVTPSIFNDASHITAKSRILQNGPILELAQTLVQNTIRKRLSRIAHLEILLNYPKKYRKVPKTNWTIFEAQKFVNQRYDPYKLKKIPIGEPPSMWHVGPFNLRGFSNFHVDDMDMLVNNNSVDIILRILTDDVHGKFPFTFHQNMGEYSAERMEFLAKIKLMVNASSSTPPILDALGYEVTNCKVHFNDKKAGVNVAEDQFELYADGIFCLLIKNEITTANIIRKIQSDILNAVDMSRLKEKISAVFYEDALMSNAY